MRSRLQAGTHHAVRRFLLLVWAAAALSAAGPAAVLADPAASRTGGRIEVVLAKEHRPHLEAVKRDFAEAGLGNVHIQFVRMGHPPMNLGVGSGVSADRARAAIRLARKYNGGVAILLPEHLFPEEFVTIASSNFDDTVEYRVDDEALRQLEDPALTSEQWHERYRRLTPADRPPARKGRRS